MRSVSTKIVFSIAMGVGIIVTIISVKYWNNGAWLALCISTIACSIVGLLVTENTILRCSVFFLFLFVGLSFGLIPLDIASEDVKKFFSSTPISTNHTDAKSLFEDFGVGLISTVLTFVTGVVLWAVKDAEDRLKKSIQHLEEIRQTIHLIGLNNKCYIHFNRLLEDPTRHHLFSRLSRIVGFFKVDFKEDEDILDQLRTIIIPDISLLNGHSESKQYLNALQNYYSDKNKESANDTFKEIVRECKRLLK
jgi:hypothetical protein